MKKFRKQTGICIEYIRINILFSKYSVNTPFQTLKSSIRRKEEAAVKAESGVLNTFNIWHKTGIIFCTMMIKMTRRRGQRKDKRLYFKHNAVDFVGLKMTKMYLVVVNFTVNIYF